MNDLPFQLLIKPSPSAKPESLSCTLLLRAVPGRRKVYQGLWGNQPVIIKIFSHKTSARRHLKREWQKLKLLQSTGLNAPKPLLYGKTQNGLCAVVAEKINGTSALDIISKPAAGKTEKISLLRRLCRHLAEQHKKGILQKDLHPGNFLLCEEGRLPLFVHQV